MKNRTNLKFWCSHFISLFFFVCSFANGQFFPRLYKQTQTTKPNKKFFANKIQLIENRDICVPSGHISHLLIV